MKPGIYRDISNEDYHKGPGLSSSGLKLLAQSPRHFKEAPREETPAMRRGTAAHCAVFEPERFKEQYVVAPDVDKRTKAGKDAWADLEAGGKIVLSCADYEDIIGMAEAVRGHSRAGALVSGGVAEQSVFWEYSVFVDDSEETILCKCRPDYIKPLGDGYVIVDLKTTTDARPDFFHRNAYKLGYQISAAHYIRGMTTTELGSPQIFIFIAVESTKPYGVIVYDPTTAFLDAGYEETTKLYETYARSRKYNFWPCYSEEIQRLELPRYAA